MGWVAVGWLGRTGPGWHLGLVGLGGWWLLALSLYLDRAQGWGEGDGEGRERKDGSQTHFHPSFLVGFLMAFYSQ